MSLVHTRGFSGRYWTHNTCGMPAIFETEEQAAGCAKNNRIFKASVGLIGGLIVAVVLLVVVSATVGAEYGSDAAVAGFLLGAVMGYVYAHDFPFGPVYQYRQDMDAIRSKLVMPNLMGKKDLTPEYAALHANDMAKAKEALIASRAQSQIAHAVLRNNRGPGSSITWGTTTAQW